MIPTILRKIFASDGPEFAGERLQKAGKDVGYQDYGQQAVFELGSRADVRRVIPGVLKPISPPRGENQTSTPKGRRRG
jgi:hypothetical protein